MIKRLRKKYYNKYRAASKAALIDAFERHTIDCKTLMDSYITQGAESFSHLTGLFLIHAATF
jgi:hypothetical protein